MNGEMANLICLTTYGNQFLMGPKSAKAPELVTTNSTFQFTSRIDFYEVKGTKRHPREFHIAKGTREWFQYLRKKGVTRLRLAAVGYNNKRPYMPDRVAVAFAGSANWALVSESKDGNVVWILQDFTIEDFSYSSKVKRIWESEVRGYTEKVPLRDPPTSIEAAESALEDALIQIIRFSKPKTPVRDWVQWFNSALDTLDKKKTPTFKYWTDLSPKGWMDVRTRRLVAAAQRAWVFGGMCSWNDVGYTDKGHSYFKEYTRVSNLLYETMIDALVFGANEVPVKERVR
jgi:hypothetical protein